MLGDREILLLSDLEETDAATAKTNTLKFNIQNIPPGEYFVRLRVDGIDSLLVDRSVNLSVFDATH